jgi:hypothetical protein
MYSDSSKAATPRMYVYKCISALRVPSCGLVRTDYICYDGRFQVSASGLSSLNPALLSSSGTGVNFGIEIRKKCLSESAQCQQAISDIYFTET